MKKEIIIITAMLALIMLLAISDIKAQDSAYVYLVRDSAQLITTNKIIVSSEFVNVLMEPIPGKVTRWTITRTEEQADSMVVLVDDADDKTIYKGAWVNGTYHTFYKGTLSYSYTVGAYIEYKFTARKIQWFSERNITHGRAAVSIDGGPEIILLPSSLGIDYLREKASYSQSWPTVGGHTIKIRVLDAKSILHDYFRLVK